MLEVSEQRCDVNEEHMKNSVMLSLLLSHVVHGVRDILSNGGTGVNVMWSNKFIFSFLGVGDCVVQFLFVVHFMMSD